MNQSNAMVVADMHVHLYPHFDIPLAIRHLIRNLRRISGVLQTQTDANLFLLGFLTESQGINFFRHLQNDPQENQNSGIEIQTGPETETITIRAEATGDIRLIAGRQIVSCERLEILALAMRAEIPNGLPANEIIRQTLESGGIPVLAWAPGKWFFKRGQLVRSLLQQWGAKLMIGDTALRPTCWPEPRLMRDARKHGSSILPGSDPLPLAAEEKRLGQYGLIYRGIFDPAFPAASMRKALAESSPCIQPAGTRCGAWQTARRLINLRTVPPPRAGL